MNLHIPTDGLSFIREEQLVIGKYYYFISRIESCDYTERYNYENLCAYFHGRYIGMYKGIPIFQRESEQYEEAVLMCISNPPRFIYDALDADEKLGLI